MKTLIASAMMLTTLAATEAAADTWTWTPISNGSTLNAHLARCDFARPNPMVVFDVINDLQKNMVPPQPQDDDAQS